MAASAKRREYSIRAWAAAESRNCAKGNIYIRISKQFQNPLEFEPKIRRFRLDGLQELDHVPDDPIGR